MQKKRRTGWGMPSTRYALKRVEAVKAGHPFLLTREEFGRYWGMPCHYSGAEIETIGLDRVDSYGPYSVENTVPCCWLCNVWKQALTMEQFRAHLDRLHRVLIQGQPVPSEPYRPPLMRKRGAYQRTSHPDTPPGPIRGRGAPLRFAVEQVRDALRESRGNISLAARRLDCARETIWRYLLRYPDLEADLAEQRVARRARSRDSSLLMAPTGKPIRVADRGQQGAAGGRPLKHPPDRIREALAQAGGDAKAAAKRLGCDRTTVYLFLRKERAAQAQA